MRIAIIGTGYVGLVTGACLAAFGHHVICIDQSASKISLLEQCRIPFHEPGLEQLVCKHLGVNLFFAASAANPVAAADAVILAVGTPPLCTGEADLTQLFRAVADVIPHLGPRASLIVKSTVPVGTARRLRQFASERLGALCVPVISNPEFLREGSAIRDFMQPDRIVIGHDREVDLRLMRDLYAPLLAAGVPMAAMSNESAELCKYASNVFLAMRVAYVNELADLCEALGADIGAVVQGMALDHRIGCHHFQPGPGFGGSCFSKDIAALQNTADEAGLNLGLGRAIAQSNALRKAGLAPRVARALGGILRGRKIAVLGLAFKANTDDLRDSPALTLAADLQASGAEVLAYDPALKGAEVAGLELCARLEDAMRGADAAVIMTEWDEFRALALETLPRQMRQPLVIDFRNLFSPASAKAAGIIYHSLGRPSLGSKPDKPAVAAPSQWAAQA